jgi:hypothetical protein
LFKLVFHMDMNNKPSRNPSAAKEECSHLVEWG